MGPPRTPAPGTAPAPREPLGRDRIVAAAVEMTDAEGLTRLSMRSLAGRLGYEAMSLYNHVAGKDELLGLMVDAVLADVEPVEAGTAPLASVRSLAVSVHEVLAAHPWAAELWLRHTPGPRRLRLMEDLLAGFARSGLPPEVAHLGFHAVSNHVVGYALQETGMRDATADPQADTRRFLAALPDGLPHTAAHVRQHLAGDTAPSFEPVLDLILDGLVRLAAPTTRRSR